MSSKFDLESMLRWGVAHARSAEESGLLSDGQVTVFWDNVPLSALEEARAWLKTNRATVTDLSADYKPYEGTYRLGTVTHEGVSGGSAKLVAEFRLDHDTALDWSNARLEGGAEQLTASGSGHGFLTVKFPSILNTSLADLMGSVRNKEYSDPEIGGEAFSGTYKCLSAIPKLEDGSTSLTLVLVEGNYSLTSFRNYGLPTEEEIAFIWGLPKDEAQAVIDGYKLEGYTVTVSHSMSSDVPGTVDLVITHHPSKTFTELQTSYAANCTTTITTIYRWSMTKAEVDAFIDTVSASGGAGVERSVRISFNENTGRYDASITTSTVNTDGVTLSAIFYSDEDTMVTTTYKWGVSKDNAEAYITAFGIRETTKRKNLRVSRNSNCTYDIVATLSEPSAVLAELTVSYGNTELSLRTDEYFWNLSKTQLEAEITARDDKEGATQKSFRVSRNEDKTYDAVFTSTVSDETTITGTYGAAAESNTFEYNFSVDSSELAGVLNSLTDDNNEGAKSVSVSRNGDDTYNISSRFQLSKPDQKSFSYFLGSEQHQVDFYFGQTRSSAFGIIDALPQDGSDFDIRLSRANDGTYNLTIRRSRDPGEFMSVTVENDAEITLYEFHYGLTLAEANQKIAALDATGTTDRRFSLRPRRDNKYDLTISLVDEKQANTTKTSQVGANFNITTDYGWGGELGDVPVPTYLQGREQSVSFSRDRDGRVDHANTRRVVTPFTSDHYTVMLTPKAWQKAYFFRWHVTPPSLPSAYGTVQCEYDPSTNTYSGRVTYFVILITDGNDFDNVQYDYIVNELLTYEKTNGSKYRFYREDTYKILQTTSKLDAEGYANGGAPGSGVQKLAGGYKAVYIEHGDWPTAGQWLPIAEPT